MKQILTIAIHDSALKHGINRQDIQTAFATCIYNKPLVDEPGKELLLGFGVSGAILEIIFLKDTTLNITVIHAMSCRKKYLELI